MRLRLSMCPHLARPLPACLSHTDVSLSSLHHHLSTFPVINSSFRVETALSGAYRIRGQSHCPGLTSAQIPEIGSRTWSELPSSPRLRNGQSRQQPDNSCVRNRAHVSKPRSPLFGGWWASLHIDNDSPARPVLESASSEG